MSSLNAQFEALIEKYRTSPEFMFVDLKDPNQPGMTGDTLLHAAVVRANLEDVRILLGAGANANVIGDLGNTPLHGAASRGHVDIIKELLEAGADRNIRNEFGQTPLDLALLMKRSEAVRALETSRQPDRKGTP